MPSKYKRACMVVYAFYESDTRVIQYAQALLGQGISVDVLSIGREGAPKFEIIDGVSVTRIQTRVVNERGKIAYLSKILRFAILSTLVLAKRHLSNPYDVVHVHSVPDFLVFSAAVPKMFGARVILDIHDILPEFYASKFGISQTSLTFRALVLVEKISARFADHVIIANDLWQGRITARSVPAAKCTTVINYPDLSIFYPRSDSRKKLSFVFMYPGTLNWHQGLDIAVEAFAKAAKEMSNAEFHIYGEGPTREALIALSEQLGMADRIRFFGFLPTREVAEKMAAADVAVVPKRASSAFGNEAASTKIMEFMSLGVPVIVSRTRIDTHYHNDSRVQFVKSEDVEAFGHAMARLYRDPELRKSLASNASQYIVTNNWAEKKSEYLALVGDQPVSANYSPAAVVDALNRQV